MRLSLQAFGLHVFLLAVHCINRAGRRVPNAIRTALVFYSLTSAKVLNHVVFR